MLRKFSPAFFPATVAMTLALGACSGDDDGETAGTSDGTDSTTSAGTDTTTSDGTDTTQGTSTSATSTTGDTDTATTGPTTGATDTATTTATTGANEMDVFRFTEMYVRDPHFYIDIQILGCTDVTNGAPLGMDGVNDQFNNAINSDGDDPPDGNLDLSLLLMFDPFDDSDAGSGDVDYATGDCLVPAENTVCSVTPMTTPSPAAYANDAANNCLEVNPDHITDTYTPQATPATPKCFNSQAPSMELNLGTFSLELQDVEVAATYVDADNLDNGLMRGFLTEEEAKAAMLPQDLQDQFGVMVVADLLPGSDTNCAGHSDKDDNNGTAGWWMYVNFKAQRVPFQ